MFGRAAVSDAVDVVFRALPTSLLQFRRLTRLQQDTEGYICPLNIHDIDALLDELASKSRYSDGSVRNRIPPRKRRKREDVLKDLFRPLCPFDAACLAQIILKDLRPLMYPLSEKQLHYSAALKIKSNSIKELTIYDVMKIWDPTFSMLKIHHVCYSLGDAADVFQRGEKRFRPSFGIQLAVPKSRKGRSIHDALSPFQASEIIWAETKYDGERAQIHIQVTNGTPTIKIFSKSKRDSTNDRIAVHPVILECLGLADQSRTSQVRRDVILDAEMVPFSGEKIEEFWRIRGLIQDTAIGACARRKPAPDFQEDTQETDYSPHLDRSDDLCLGLVFFDIMHLNGESLLSTPYKKRRAVLESLIRQIPGKAILAQRWPIHMSSTQRRVTGLLSWKLPPRKANDGSEPSTAQGGRPFTPEQSLAKIFAQRLASYEEGLVLKASESLYNDWKIPWVKLKADYIPGLGDGLDLVILGACWHKERAMELRVPRSVLTTFHIGVLVNQDEIAARKDARHKFRVYFTVSYGLSRSELEDINCRFKGSDHVVLADVEGHRNLPYDFELRKDIPAPEILLMKPWLAEVYGDRFTKTNHYPDLKITSTDERDWKNVPWVQVRTPLLICGVRRQQRRFKDLWTTVYDFGKINSASSSKAIRKRKGPCTANESPLARKRQRVIEVDENGSSYDSSSTGSQASHECFEEAPRSQSTKPSSQPLQDAAVNIPGFLTSEGPHATSMPRHETHVDSSSSRLPNIFAGQNNGHLNIDVKSRYPSPPSSPTKPASSKQVDDLDHHHISGKQSNKCQTIPFGKEAPTTSAHINIPAIVDFFRDAVIWYEGGESFPMLDSVRDYLEGNRVHGTEAVLTGCGWHPTCRGSPWVKRGVIFLDAKSSEQFKPLLAEREKTSTTGLRKPLWIFNRETFEWVVSLDDLKVQALAIIS
ncbi:hypothetical protein VNI00_000857 [Paramarasmius palmivorus]|uniref:ATP-dependent DNA ligase family profile domain-containing protein n=1 Tax=Paramarasmius palmivorus TaxID=297713 RepID=A0AAW0EBI1_9AGAR